MSIKKLSKAFNIYSGEKPLSGALRLLYIGLLVYAVMMLFFLLMFSMTRDDDLEIKKIGNVFCPLSVMLINFIARHFLTAIFSISFHNAPIRSHKNGVLARKRP